MRRSSLARRADQLPYGKIAVVEAKAKKQDHAWAFSPMPLQMMPSPWRGSMGALADCHRSGAVTQPGDTHPYLALKASLADHCRQQARSLGVELIQGQVTDTTPNSITTEDGVSQQPIITAAPTLSQKV